MRRFIKTTCFIAAGLASCATSLAQENFDEPGASWNPTIYVARWARGGVFWRSTFAGDPCLPGNNLLPIAAGGDKEGAYSNPGPQACEAYGMVSIIPAHQLTDTRTEGFIKLCPLPGSNDRATAGFVSRARMGGPAQPGPDESYMAVLSSPPGTNDVYVLLIHDTDGCLDTGPVDGIIDNSDILSVAGPIGTTDFNYYLRFDVSGNTLTATARRMFVAGGALASDPPVTITAVDNAIPDGFNGVVASAAWGNRVYWDDVDISLPGGGGPGNPDGDHVGEHGSACACDWTNDGDVTSQDFFEFLNAMLADSPDADVNGDDTVNSQDFFAFLGCFFNNRC
jgi:hypothetical protein